MRFLLRCTLLWFVVCGGHAEEKTVTDEDFVVFSPEDIDDMVREFPSALDYLPSMCSKASQRCVNKCGQRAISLRPGFVPKKERVLCSCDTACTLYGDCCWDYWQACSRYAAQFPESLMGFPRPTCLGYHAFLAYDEQRQRKSKDVRLDASNGEEKANSPTAEKYYKMFDSGDTRDISLNDIAIMKDLGLVAVTDKMTGLQYRSEEDFLRLHPTHRDVPGDRLLRWRLNVIGSTRQVIPAALKMMENRYVPMNESLQFTFSPPANFPEYLTRTCIPDALLTCTAAKNTNKVRVVNVTQLCEYLFTSAADGGYGLERPDWKGSTAWQSDAPVKTESAWTTPTGPTTSKPDPTVHLVPGTVVVAGNDSKMEDQESFFAKTTPEANVSVVYSFAKPCSHIFSLSLSWSRKPFTFSYLLDLQTSGSIVLKRGTHLSSWSEISCLVTQPDPSSDSLTEVGRSAKNTSGNVKPCEIQITCISGLVLVNGDCLDPIVILLKINSSPEVVDTGNFQAAVRKVHQSAQMFKRTHMLLHYDNTSCFSRNNENQSSNSNSSVLNINGTTSYYGVYYIMMPLIPREGEYLPLQDALRLSFGLLQKDNRSQFASISDASLCFLVRNKGQTWQLLTKHGINFDRLRDEYHQGKGNYELGKLRACARLPWAFRGDDVLQSPNLKCYSVFKQKENSNGTDTNRMSCHSERFCKSINKHNKATPFHKACLYVIFLAVLSSIVKFAKV